MANIHDIQEVAHRLNLYNISRGDIDLSGESKGNLDFLYRILHEEQSLRDSARVIKWEQESRLPRREFETERLNSGTRWQIEQLDKLHWIEDEQNLFLIGKCGSGKTSLAAHLGREALRAGIKVTYTKVEDFLYTLHTKDHITKQRNRYKYWLSSSLIIVDDFMYAGMTEEDLTVFYHTIMLLNETRSIVIITNRELFSLQSGHDTFLLQTLIERLSIGSQMIRLS